MYEITGRNTQWNGQQVFGQDPKVQEIKEKINEWDFIKLKCFWRANKTTVQRRSGKWGKIFASCKSEKRLTSRIYKDL